MTGPRDEAGPVGVGVAILLGYVSLAVAFGAAARSIGISAGGAAGMSILVFAGASQFVAISLLAQGAGLAAIVAATLVLNSRHIVMSMALADRIEGRRVPRPILAFGVTDEVFAAAAARPGQVRDTDLLVMESLAYSGWVTGTVLGYLLGSILPEIVQQAMGIALYAMFVALIVPTVQRAPRTLVPALAAGGVNWALQALGAPVGAALLASIALVAAFFAVRPGWVDA